MTPKAIRKTLAQFRKQPQGSSEDSNIQLLSEAYEQAMERIMGQKAGLKELALQVLSWITCAKAPLSIPELQHALAVEVGESDLDSDNLPEVEDMVSVCGGLVTVDEESKIIRLVHYTTQEYLERTREKWFGDAHRDLAITCLTYLSFDVFETYKEGWESSGLFRRYPLYEYSAVNWGHHAREAAVVPEDSIEQFFANPVQTAAAFIVLSQHAMSQVFVSFRANLLESRPIGLFLAAWFGLEETMKRLLAEGCSPNAEVAGRTPLSYAVENGQDAIVDLLLERPDVEVDAGENTPLLHAIEAGHDRIVERLLARGADPNARDITSMTRFCTALHLAAKHGKETIVRLLLAHGARVDPEDSRGKTPLSWAAQSGHEAVVKLLLEAGAKPARNVVRARTMPSHVGGGDGRQSIDPPPVRRRRTGAADPNAPAPTFFFMPTRDTLLRLLRESGYNMSEKERKGRARFTFPIDRQGLEQIAELRRQSDET